MQSTVTIPTRSTEFIPLVTVHDNEADWLADRRKSLQASEVAGILGVGYANQSPMAIWADKTGKAECSLDSSRDDLLVGRLLEPSLRAILQAKTGYDCEPAGTYTIYRNPEFPIVGATLDSWVHHPDLGPIPGELKAVSYFAREGWGDDEELPLKFQVQSQVQMFCTGSSHGIVFGLVNHRPVWRLLERNDRFMAAVTKKVTEFWRCVESGEQPDPDDSAATAAILAKLYPRDNGATVHLDAKFDGIAADLAKAKADKKDAEARELAASNQIKAAIGDATFGVTHGGVKFSWKEQTRAGYVVEETSFRVLRTCK